MKLRVPRFKQRPFTCGSSALQQVLAYYGVKKSLNEVLKNVKTYKYGSWGCDVLSYALKLGFEAEIITRDLNIFDPTWFKLDRNKLIKKLKSRIKYAKKNDKHGITGYTRFLELGGRIRFGIITENMIKDYLKKKIPVIACICSTALWKCKRIYSKKIGEGYRSIPSDVKGKPEGHFLVISGYTKDKFIVTDPHYKIPNSKTGIYTVPTKDLIAFILMWEYGNVCVIKPKN